MVNLAENKKSDKQLYIIAIVTFLIGFLFYVLNYYTPLYGDDYLYSFSFLNGERMTSINQVIDSQFGHYQNMNGRIVTHALAQIFLIFGDKVFNFINVFFFILLLYLIYFHGCGSFKNFSISKFSMIAMLLFLCSPAFGQSFLWITGAANYLYGILIILIFMIPYRLQFDGKVLDNNIFLKIFFAILYLVFGIIAGWTNENTSVAMIVMIIGYIVLYAVKSMKIRAWNITGCIGGVIGCILMLFAPGTTNRLNTFGGSGGIVSWVKRVLFYSCDLIVYLHLIIIIFFILFVVYLCQKKEIFESRLIKDIFNFFKESGIVFIYLLGFLASVYSMIVSPLFPERAWSGPIVLFLISLISLNSLIDMSDIKLKIGKTITISFILILSLATYFNVFFELKNVDSFYDKRIHIIEKAVLNGEKSVEIPSIYGDSGYSCYSAHGDLNADSNEWPNTAIAQYYEVDEIICSD